MPHPLKPAGDVRMRGFAKRHTVSAALAWLDAQLQPLEAEDVPLRSAAGRVLAAPVVADVDVPGFDRAAMDGYAVAADSTEGASQYNHVHLAVIGQAMPGLAFEGIAAAGEAVRVMTGAPMPCGADSVLPAEWTEEGQGSCISALAAVSPGKHVGKCGEDILRGTTLFERGECCALRISVFSVLSGKAQPPCFGGRAFAS